MPFLHASTKYTRYSIARLEVAIYLTSLTKLILPRTCKSSMMGSKIYGICLYGDGTTIRQKPILNIFVASVKKPSTVLGIADATAHLSAGGKKYSRYLCSQPVFALCWPLLFTNLRMLIRLLGFYQKWLPL